MLQATPAPQSTPERGKGGGGAAGKDERIGLLVLPGVPPPFV